MKDWPEILLIDKPAGITSFDVIRRLRCVYLSEFNARAKDKTFGVTKIPKMGHAGTLDPLATGLMIIGIGTGTKKLQKYLKLNKEYIAKILIGERRTTGDMEGEITEEKKVTEDIEILRFKISTELLSMIGTCKLPVSAYSAIKKNGIPMYKRARKAALRGEIIKDVPVRDMMVYEAELLDINSGDGKAVATVRFLVSSGTYIRSLSEELGRRLDYPATLKNLRRTKIGNFDITEAKILET